ncbi:MAG: hypothetical protein HUJ31_05710 [Pseudomonadales bacterium]|nr:hypothetical protein [Pseudomonadales bacterium]
MWHTNLIVLIAAVLSSAPAFAGSFSISAVYVDKRTYCEGPLERRSDNGIALRYRQRLASSRYLIQGEFQSDGGFRYASVSGGRVWKVAEFEVYGGLQFYRQRSPGLDHGDTGSKLIAGIMHTVGDWSIAMDYLSEDLEGADPDDAGDFVELARYQIGIYRVVTDDVHLGMSISSTSNGGMEYGAGVRFRW